LHALSQSATFRFYAELNDFLPKERRFVRFRHDFVLASTVKDMVESFGVPHTEIDLILVNGRSVGFDYRVRDGDDVSVYPMFETFDISPLVCLRPEPLREPRFILDTHLGKLARYLRMLGFDSLYGHDMADEDLALLSRRQRRILLTRDVGLLKRNTVTHGYWVRSNQPTEQLREVVERFDLYRCVQPFTRCLCCNGKLEPVSKEEIAHRLLPRTRAHQDQFVICSRCGRIYWPGSHYVRMRRSIEELLGRIDGEGERFSDPQAS